VLRSGVPSAALGLRRRIASRARALLLDIEGTTTPLSFVHDVLFPYARERLEAFLRDRGNSGVVGGIVAALSAERAAGEAGTERPPAWRASSDDEATASAIAYCRWLMDHDRKSPALKQLQGLIWDRGYDTGELHGVVFPDVPPAFQRWRAEGRTIAIYSSGSELAQRRLFATTAYGDLTPFIARFFDTAVGPKVEAESYRQIAAALGTAPADICFVSDVARELRPAREAGFDVRLAVRPGNAPREETDLFTPVAVFDKL
jgi:enolase-phosphatase E1